MTKSWMGALLAVGLAGCGSDAPPGAHVAQELTLPDSALTRLQDVSLIRAGDGFTMAGYDTQVRWARLSLDGVLTEAAGFALPQTPVVGPVFATAMKTAPADQLIAIFVTSSTTTPGSYVLTAMAQTMGDAAASAPVTLATFPAGAALPSISITAGGAQSGNVGFAAWGVRGTGTPVSFAVLGANGVVSATGTALTGDSAPPAWDCLATSNEAGGMIFSAVAPSSTTGFSDFHTVTLDASGVPNPASYGLLADPTDCHIVGSPALNGEYDIAFQDQFGIGFSVYYPALDPSQDGSVITEALALSASVFGDPLHLPSPAWVAPAGSDLSIGLARSTGPLVVRLTYDDSPHGAWLPLRTQEGQTGPVAAWVGPDYVYATYTDRTSSPAAGSTTARYFVKIESPATLP